MRKSVNTRKTPNMFEIKRERKKVKRFFASFPSFGKMFKIIQPNKIE